MTVFFKQIRKSCRQGASPCWQLKPLSTLKLFTMMNNSKTNETLRRKLLAFIPMIAILFISFSACGEVPSKKATEIQGTWKLVSYNYGGDSIMKPVYEKLERLKLITDSKFCWIHFNSEDHIVTSSAGGSYSFDGENYTENLEFGGMGMKDYLGKSQKFTVKVENNKLYLSGALSDGLKIKEVWERIGTK
jgi:hypothetical protein